MLTTLLASSLITFIAIFTATVFHMRAEAENQISVSELWKIRAYQEDPSNKIG